jgi:DNA replication and repair protein RecF
VRVHELELGGFRSYLALNVNFPPGPQVVFGANAAGKTNLVEALALLARGQSHRTHNDQELIRWGEPFVRVRAQVAHDADPGARLDELEVVVATPGSGAARKRIRVNGVPRRSEALSATLRVVVFSPEAMMLVAGAPSLRRDELDELAAQRLPTHGRRLSTYARALAQRNSLLRAIREGEARSEELVYWDQVVVEEGGAIVDARMDLLAELAGPLEAAHTEIAPGEPPLSLSYVTNAPARPGEDPAAALRRRLTETAEKELWNGATLVGPHRDDVAFRLGDRDLATFGSRGQQRTAILALKLAELDSLARTDGVPPLLLLDDVFSELDPERRAHLVRRIQALPQAFVTTTALSDLDAGLVAESTAWRVTPGRLVRSVP